MNITYSFTGDSHTAEPVADSFYTQLGKPADLFRALDYPIEAVCRKCNKPVVALSFLREFQHAERTDDGSADTGNVVPIWQHFTR